MNDRQGGNTMRKRALTEERWMWQHDTGLLADIAWKDPSLCEAFASSKGLAGRVVRIRIEVLEDGDER